jgi:hypothetical protein
MIPHPRFETYESTSMTTDIELNDPLQNFGNRQPRTSDTVLYTNQNKTNNGKTRKSEKKWHPLVPRYFGMRRIDTSEIGA